MNIFGVYVSVPVACFRVPRAREYFETFPCPPPATVYGMLLSMIGEVNRYIHEGAEIAIAMLSNPDYSIVLRTLWRVKNSKEGLGLGTNRRPDFQELLTDVRLAVWVKQGEHESNKIPLVDRIRTAINQPNKINRFGGLSLGESTHLVDEIFPLGQQHKKGQLLISKEDGDLSLPIWPDHVCSSTRWGQYKLVDSDLTCEIQKEAWTIIQRPN